MAIQTERHVLRVPDGSEMALFAARPERAGAPGLLVFQEAFGVNRHIQALCEAFAREGWLAAAPELYHRTAPGFEARYDDIASARPHMQAMTDGGIRADQQAASDWLRGQGCPAVGAIGYCMGGRMAFLANANLPLAASVSYYGGGIQLLGGRVPELHGPMLFHWAGRDAHVTPDHARTVEDLLRAEGRPFTSVTFSEADHGFNCDERASHHPESARHALAVTLAFLRDHLH
ncbi:carboxymethylenebutenolidase [Geothrix rubra]|uniref:Carboxymethylenebutenolidase n=1 Tax=Geothrix rubra TaxID=2927977 RepID=A0ABQ5Q2Z7_9BACT|nr:dienelactone hydrolase family protein [Geothrix rubra]GLH68869.1 carboxymethylenebutenolidase [Geothrix rubra]